MRRPISVVLALLVFSSAAALTLARQGSEGALRFRTFRPCIGNASFCGERILISGELPHDAAERFVQFLDAGGAMGSAVVCFDTGGGSLRGGVNLGRVIRARAFDTCLQRTYSSARVIVKADGQVAEQETILAEGTVCASACMFAFSGGVNREVETGAMLGVHQFAGTNSEVLAQLTLAELASFIDEMGIGRTLLDTAARVPPWQMHWLQADDVSAMRLDTTVGTISAWALEASEDGVVFATVTAALPHEARSIVTVYIGDAREPHAIMKFTPPDGNLASALRALDGSNARLLVDGVAVGESTPSRWGVLEPNSLVTFIPLRSDCRSVLSDGVALEIRMDVARATYEYDPSVKIPLVGLKRFLPAVLREAAQAPSPSQQTRTDVPGTTPSR